MKRCPACTQRFSRDAAFCPFDGTRLETAPFEPFVDALIGTRVDGRYDVVALLGEGGMGRIYEVRHAALNRAFAMKVLRPELAQDSELAARFIREAKATASVKHPNVVQITDFGRLPDSVPYFAMELLVGHTLGEVIKAAGPVPPTRGSRIVRKVAGALGAAHAAGVVHRDLKPDNVFLIGGSRDLRAPDDPDRIRSLAVLGDGADVRVVDFGAAKIVGSRRVTREGVVFGTPHYMAPEQASGQPVDHRADIYSLGVIMYEMFTGRVPFEADTYMGVLTQHMFVRPLPPSQMPQAVEELGALEGIVLRCLEKKPEDRFGSMDDVIEALDDAVLQGGDGDLEASWRRPGLDRASGRPAPVAPIAIEAPPAGGEANTDPSWPPSPSPPRSPGAAPWALVLGGVGAIAVAVAAIMAVRWLLPPDRANAPAPSPAVVVAASAAPVPSRTAASAGWVAAPVPVAPGVVAAGTSTVDPVPSPGVAPGVAPDVARVGEAAMPSGKAAPHVRHAASGPSVPNDMEDVDDPFAKH
jgi:serine/threonine-protein kinase